MPTRIIEVGMVYVVLFSAIFFVHAAGIVEAPLLKEAIEINSYKAKNVLLALENYKSTNPSYSDKTVIKLIHLGYITNKDAFFTQASNDISYYLPRVLGSEWKVYTNDGRIDVSGPNFYSTKIRGSAQTKILENATLVVVVGY